MLIVAIWHSWEPRESAAPAVTLPWHRFLAQNEGFPAEEIEAARQALAAAGEYRGGGGAAGRWTIRRAMPSDIAHEALENLALFVEDVCGRRTTTTGPVAARHCADGSALRGALLAFIADELEDAARRPEPPAERGP